MPFPILGEYAAYGPVTKTEYRISGCDADCGSGYCANKQSSKHCPSAGGEGESASYQSFYHSISGTLTCSEECCHYCDMYAQQAKEQNYSVPLASWQIASTNRFFGISYCRFDVSDIDIVGCALFCDFSLIYGSVIVGEPHLYVLEIVFGRHCCCVHGVGVRSIDGDANELIVA